MVALIGVLSASAMLAGLIEVGVAALDSANNGNDNEAATANLMVQAETIIVAMEARALNEAGHLSSLDKLVEGNYMPAIPTPPEQVYQVEWPVPSERDWEVRYPGLGPLVMLRNKLNMEACLLVNKKSGYEGVKEQPDSLRRIQCVGSAAPFTLMLNPTRPRIGMSIDCHASPHRPECKPPEEFCKLTPANAGCEPVPINTGVGSEWQPFCARFPEDPTCGPEDAFCQKFPTHIGCWPVNCATKPASPECKALCEREPSYVDCVGANRPKVAVVLKRAGRT